MKFEKKLYLALQSLAEECVSDMGLPQKPTVLGLHRAVKILYKYEKEIKRRDAQIVQATAEPLVREVTNKEILDTTIKCDACDGEGYSYFINQGEPDLDTLCPKCKGTGRLEKE